MSVREGYRAIREGAAVGAIAPAAQIAVAGPDRATFLQGLLTNDVVALTAGTGCYAAWLTPQGRMLTDVHVLESGTMMLLDLPAAVLDATFQRLDQFLFSEDVQLESLAATLGSVWIHGPAAAQVLERTLAGAEGAGAWAAYHHANVSFGGVPVVLARIDQLGVPGYCAYVAPAQRPALLEALESAGATPATDEDLQAARIEAGYPLFGVDMTEDTIPLEAGIEHQAISFTKGCYVGQEIIIRVLHRGGGRVARKLVALKTGPVSAAPGARILAGGKAVGHVTSAAHSPHSSGVALGYVHRNFVEAGTAVEIETPEGSIQAEVTTRPLPTGA